LRKGAQEFLERLASVELTLFCLALAMVLVVFGTLAQVRMGTFAAQKMFFNRWWIPETFGDWRIPVFPGGLTVGALWTLNLIAAFIARFKYRRKDAGILISHFGLILLLIGQFVAQRRGRESLMPLQIGQTLNYSEAARDMELALIDTSDPRWDEVTSIPDARFSRPGEITLPGKPFSLVIRKFDRNAQLAMGSNSLATEGIGPRISVQELPPVTSDDQDNILTAWVDVREAGRSLGVWLVSSGLGAPQSFEAGGRSYRIAFRPRRYYYPFSLTLKDFRHDIYPGTDIAKNFSSRVHLFEAQTGESRDALIYMNHPLRYHGNTFYQASFGQGDKLSVLQVVKNPAWVAPYLSCFLVILGLVIQFFMHLSAFIRRRPQ